MLNYFIRKPAKRLKNFLFMLTLTEHEIYFAFKRQICKDSTLSLIFSLLFNVIMRTMSMNILLLNDITSVGIITLKSKIDFMLIFV